ncbi:MAG: hypothetical protein JWR09_373 [Mucilaginibacter sp.]|nr:hypothetical protein [Mucilaginibacter sp.]
MFHSVPGVPRAKMERLQPKLALRLSVFGEGFGVSVCLYRTHVKLMTLGDALY